MVYKVPIIGSSVTYKDLMSVFSRMEKECVIGEFSRALAGLAQARHIHLTNSGTASFYIILKILKERSGRKEVILPAYTAGSLVVSVIKAGLKPVLCDVSQDDFNFSEESLFNAISKDTLAVAAVHMFGLVVKDIRSLQQKLPRDVILIEDCAQSMGSSLDGRHTGSFGKISFFSFNRGKNLALYGGGSIATNDDGIAAAIGKELRDLKKENRISKFTHTLKILAFSLSVKPFIYGLGFPIISRFKDTAPPRDISIKRISDLHAGLGSLLMEKSEGFFSKRHDNGSFLLDGLKEKDSISLPKILKDSRPVFNRLPILFKDLKNRDVAREELWAAGIEASRMYMRPLHHMFDIGYKRRDFPCANYIADHLLTLPVHPQAEEKKLYKIIEVMNRA